MTLCAMIHYSRVKSSNYLLFHNSSFWLTLYSIWRDMYSLLTVPERLPTMMGFFSIPFECFESLKMISKILETSNYRIIYFNEFFKVFTVVFEIFTLNLVLNSRILNTSLTCKHFFERIFSFCNELGLNFGNICLR